VNKVTSIYNVKMFSREYTGYTGAHSLNKTATSYTFGPHQTREGGYVYYSLDHRVVHQDPAQIEAFHGNTPAWVIADLMLSAHRGQPLTAAEQELTRGPFASESLTWLQRTLKDLVK